MNRQPLRVFALVLLAAALSGCAASRAFHRGQSAGRASDWDAAVVAYRQALQAKPNSADYKIALERAMLSASQVHLKQARALESTDQVEDALREYRKASEYDPPNRQLASKVTELEKTIRDRIEASRPKPPITQMKERARQTSGEPLLNPASREPLNIRFNNAAIRDVLNFIGNATGINISYDRDFQDRSYTVALDGVTLEQALQQILSANGLFYKVLNERTIMVIPDTPPKRAQFEEQVIRTFYISHADSTELAQLLNTVIRVPSMAVQPMIAANKTANTITIRATANVAAIIEKVIENNDTPRAEVVVDVQILEVSRTRAKEFGLNLTDYAIGAIFSPESAPSGTPSTTTAAINTGSGSGVSTTTAGTGTAPRQVASPPAFSLNTITRGISTADFFLAVPAAFVRFIETDSQTRVIAKPQLRGAEGEKLTLNLGDEVPVPSTTFTPLAAGGAATSPMTSFNYKDVGVNVEMTPRVTFEGDIILDLTVESSKRGDDVIINGQNLPSFGSRKVKTRLRLRDGESNLLAGLLREDERRSLSGFPGLIRVPMLNRLFASNVSEVKQTDIIMLLTPRIVRSHELTQQDVSPIYIGTQQNLGLGGPPPLIAGGDQGAPAMPPAAPPAGAPEAPRLPAGSSPTPVVPPGSSPIPGTTTTPAPSAPAAPAVTPPVTLETVPVPAEPPPAVAAPQVLLTPPGTEFRVGGGPYTVPISITGAQRLSTVTVSIAYNPAVLRVRNVQEGSFMRQGGVNAAFTQSVDATGGRIDIAVSRTGDTAGASGSGLLGAVLFEPVAPGTAQLAGNGAGTLASGGSASIQVNPVTVTVR